MRMDNLILSGRKPGTASTLQSPGNLNNQGRRLLNLKGCESRFKSKPPWLKAANGGKMLRKKNRTLFYLATITSLITSFFLIGCGAGGSDVDVDKIPLTGSFVDSPVEGLGYATDTLGGYTGSNGLFFYLKGETVKFTLGDLSLGEAAGADVISPVSLAGDGASVSDNAATNISVLLQTLDQDGDLNNGIKISEATRDLIKGYSINFDQDPASFQADADVLLLLVDLNLAGVFTDNVIGGRDLRTVEAARAHLTASLGPKLTVATQYGLIQGYEQDSVWTFRGVPYARPPIGPYRWKAPEDPEPWSGVRSAFDNCSACSQPHVTSKWFRGDFAVGGEDCLYLNIFKPQTAEENLPVFVWIHGGSNYFGSAASYEGSALAARSNMVVVIIQYRLGPMGWFTHPAMRTGEDALDDSGNFGTLDAMKALEWVKANIAGFGGDPNNVTLAGESAGGHNTYDLLISPLAQGLFHRARIQSAGVGNTLVEDGDARAEDHIDRLLVADGSAVDLEAAAIIREGMTDAEIRAYLYGKSADEIWTAILDDLEGFSSYIDGTVLPADLMTAVTEGSYNRVPVIIGSNEYETKSFMPLYGASLGMPWLELIDVLNGTKTLDEVLPTYDDKNVYEVTGRCGARFWKAGAVDQVARAMKEYQDDVWTYLFKWGGPGSGPEPFDFIYGAGHAMEIPFFFGLDQSLWGYSFTEENEPGRTALQEAMMTYAAQFAKSGDPNPPAAADGLIEWQAWSNEDEGPKSILFDADNDQALLSMSTEELTQDAVILETMIASLTLPEDYMWIPFVFLW